MLVDERNYVGVANLRAAIERLDNRIKRADEAAAAKAVLAGGEDERRVTVRVSRGFARLLRLVVLQALATEEEKGERL